MLRVYGFFQSFSPRLLGFGIALGGLGEGWSADWTDRLNSAFKLDVQNASSAGRSVITFTVLFWANKL